MNENLSFVLVNDSNNEVSGPCRDFQPGEDDLQAFDFIRKFQLDLSESRFAGVTRITGSNLAQTAYRFEKEADLVLPTK